ncbi:TetR family transcriptional regulator C-terminal domain-containing protein [Vibrio sp. PP-XX7]
MIWGTTQFYADYETEIDMIKGRSLTDAEFNNATEFVVQMVLKGLALA